MVVGEVGGFDGVWKNELSNLFVIEAIVVAFDPIGIFDVDAASVTGWLLVFGPGGFTVLDVGALGKGLKNTGTSQEAQVWLESEISYWSRKRT